MKTKLFRRSISVLLCMLLITGIILVPTVASAAVLEDDYEIGFEQNGTTYQSLGVLEDQYDLIEPKNNKFPIISPSAKNDTHSLYKNTYKNVENYLSENDMTDGLPIVPPTKVKAEKFLGYSSYGFDDVVATVNGREVKAYMVAANAIMAGCTPEFLPVCIAYTEALSNNTYLDSLRSGKLTPMMYVNGPMGRQIGIDNTQGMTTEESNISVGRFMELALINLACIKRTNSFGNVQPLVFSENDETCVEIGWTPHHVEKGYELNDNVITATSFAMWGNNVTPATDLPEEIMKVLAWDITEKNLGGLGSASVNDNANAHRLIFITESVATALATKYKSKSALEGALVENARRPLWMRAYAYYYANTGGALSKDFDTVYRELKGYKKEDAKVTASPAWMNGITYSNIETVATMTKGNTDIIVTGDSSRNKTQVMPGGVSVNKEIKLSDNWDNLVTSVNFFPSDNFTLTEKDNTITPPSSVPSALTNGAYRILDPSTGASNLTRAGRVYFEKDTNTLYYYAQGASGSSSVVLNTNTDASFIAYLTNLGYNSSFTVNNGKLSGAVIRFSSNNSKLNNNTVALTSESFSGLNLTLHANHYSPSENASAANLAGGIAKDGATVNMSDTLRSFTVNLDGSVSMGDSTDSKFVKLSGTTVTVDPTVEAGATAIIGSPNDNGTYRTMTFVNGGDGTYTVTYNSGGTLSMTESALYLKGTFNSWSDTDALSKTENDDVVSIEKELTAGSYEFKIHNAGTDKWYGKDDTTITDTTNRLTLTATGGNVILNATGGKYEFRYELSTNKLSVYYAAPETQPAIEPSEEPETEPVTEPATQAPTTEPVTDIPATEPSTAAVTTDPATEPEVQGKTVKLFAKDYTNGDEDWYAYTWTDDQSETKWVKLKNNVATGLFDNVIFARVDKTKNVGWSAVWNQTDDLRTEDGGTYAITSWSGGTDNHLSGFWGTQYTFYYLPSSAQAQAGYNYKINYQASSGWHQYAMTKTDRKVNDVNIYSVDIVTTDVNASKLQYQVYNGESWVAQQEFSSVPLRNYADKIISSEGETVTNPIYENNYTLKNYRTVNLNTMLHRELDDNELTGIGDSFMSLELLGVQKKSDDTKSIRFVTVINREIAEDAVDYGYIAVGGNDMSTARSTVEGYTLDTAPEKNVFSCKNTSNKISGKYGMYGTDTNYKYVTFAVNNIADYTVAATFYVKDSKGVVHYSAYTNKTSTYRSCSANLNAINQ